MECIFARACGGTGPYSEGGARENLNIYSILRFKNLSTKKVSKNYLFVFLANQKL